MPTLDHQKNVAIASYALVGALSLLVLIYGLLPGLLAVCLGYATTRWLGRQQLKGRALPRSLAATVVITLPLVGLVSLALNAKGMTVLAIDQYQDLLSHMSRTVLGIRQKLPASLAEQLPEGLTAVQTWMSEQIQAQSSVLANVGRAWLHGSLLAYVGLVVGSLIAVARRSADVGPLVVALRIRAARFLTAFSSIVEAQFWIALFNAALTAIFLLAVLPLFGVEMPYAMPLVGFTFVAGLVPIVGNLLCNAVLTVVGLSVSPAVGAACLSFLVLIHKFEYFINAKIVGARVQIAAWELLAVMFAGEAIFGVSALVAAPLYYAYLKQELRSTGLI